jgi:hypothetical protein
MVGETPLLHIIQRTPYLSPVLALGAPIQARPAPGWGGLGIALLRDGAEGRANPKTYWESPEIGL